MLQCIVNHVIKILGLYASGQGGVRPGGRGTMLFIGERGIIEETGKNAGFSRGVPANSISL